MPHTPRSILLAACLSLLFLPSAHANESPPPRAKSPGPKVFSLPPDPSRLSPEQRTKAALAGTPSALSAAAGSRTPAERRLSRTPGLPAPPQAIPAAERAVLEARSQAKLEIYQRGPSPRPNQSRPAATRPAAAKPASWKPRVAPDAVNGPPGLTPAERAKAAAAGLRVPAPDGVQR